MTTAIEVWKQKLATARAIRAERSDPRPAGFWDETRAAWFNRFAGKSDRSHSYRFMAPFVRGRVLEIGPGPGAYTRLLLNDADHVTAVEPSPFMIRLLRENLGGFAHLEIVESTIEDYLGQLQAYDFTLAANVLSGIEPIDEVLRQVAACSAVLAIVMYANAATPEWSRAVQADVLGRVQADPDMPGHDDLVAVLDEMGLPYQVHNAHVPIHTFATIEDLVDWVEGMVMVAREDRRRLEAALAPFISERDGLYGLPGGGETMVVLVHPGATRP